MEQKTERGKGREIERGESVCQRERVRKRKEREREIVCVSKRDIGGGERLRE